MAAHEAALPIARVPVGVQRRLAEHRDRSAFLVPTHHAVVGDVAPEQRAEITEPYGPFGPAHAAGDALDARCLDAQALEARIEDLDRRVRIPRCVGPVGGHGGNVNVLTYR